MWFQIGFNLVSVVFGFPPFWFVVSNWFQLGFCGFPPSGLGLELVSKWFLWFSYGFKVVSTWFLWFQTGFKLVSNWFQTGFNLVFVVFVWFQSGFKVVFVVSGRTLVSNWFQIGFCGFRPSGFGLKLVSYWFLWFPPFRSWSRIGLKVVFVVFVWFQSGFNLVFVVLGGFPRRGPTFMPWGKN